jgi:hypothetical protein
VAPTYRTLGQISLSPLTLILSPIERWVIHAVEAITLSFVLLALLALTAWAPAWAPAGIKAVLT